MSFIDMLRSARGSRAAVLHEFWTQYDPNQRRVHVFFEGHDDIIFFSPFLERYTPRGSRLCTYRCEGKSRVFEAFAQITQRVPNARSVLFFVDKDLDDIIGTPWPTDPRIFVTDVYSIENYIVTRTTLKKLFRDSVRLVGVDFDDEAILNHFEHQLARFQVTMLAVMAWILVIRRGGGRPNLNNIDLRELCQFSDDCEIRKAPRSRLQSLIRLTGTEGASKNFRRILNASRELKRMPAKRIVRGKFEAWFFVEFWKRLVQQLRQLSYEAGGKIDLKDTLEHGNFMVKLAGYTDIPRSLELFLRAHFPETLEPGTLLTNSPNLPSPHLYVWWKKVTSYFRKT